MIATSETREQKLQRYLNMARKCKALYWVERKFGWRPKFNEANGRTGWYQALLLACMDGIYKYPDDYRDEELRGKPIRKFTWRIGRQCLAKGSVIFDRDGSLVRIENHKDSWKTFDSKEIFEVKVEGGYSVRCTSNHPVMTKGGWLHAGVLQPGDLVQVLDSWDKWGDNAIFDNHELAELLGLIIAKGEKWQFNRIEVLKARNFKDDVAFEDFIKTVDLDNEFPRAITYASKQRCAKFLYSILLVNNGYRKNIELDQQFKIDCYNRVYAEYMHALLNKFGICSEIIVNDDAEFKIIINNVYKDDIIKKLRCLEKPIDNDAEILQDGETAVYRPVISAKSVGYEEVYDVEFAGKGFFFSGGIRVSNSGKCIPQGTIIHTREGGLVPIEDHPNSVMTKALGEIIHIKCEDGYELRATAEHSLPVWRDGKEVKLNVSDLRIGDELYAMCEWDKWGDGQVPYSYEQLVGAGRKGANKDGEKWTKYKTVSGVLEMNEELAELLGWMVGDSNCYTEGLNNSVSFTNTDRTYLDRVRELVNKYFPDIIIKEYIKGKPSNKLHWKTGVDLSFYASKNFRGCNSLKNFLRIMDADQPCGFPRAVGNYFTKAQVCAFFRGLYGADGYIEKDVTDNDSKHYYGYRTMLACSLDRRYTEYCSALLFKLGIPNFIFSRSSYNATAPLFCLRTSHKYVLQQFADTIGNVLGKSLPDFNKVYEYKTYPKKKPVPFTRGDDGEKFRFAKIKSITKEEKLVPCYDVEYPGKGEFVTSGSILVKNSEVLSLGALYLGICKPITYFEERRYKDSDLITPENPHGWTKKKVWFKRGAKIIVASADADKVKTVFDRVMVQLNKSEEYKLMLENGVIEMKLHPFPQLKIFAEGWTQPAEITFRGPGANGQALRSKTFDYKLYDEVDYMPEAFFSSERATSINAGEDALTILSSTPSGRRGYFFRTCFIADTPILTANGTFKNIQDIKINDKIINRHGNKDSVIDTIQQSYTGYLVSLTTTLNDTLITSTENHKFMSIVKQDRWCTGCQSVVLENGSECIMYGEHQDYKTFRPEYRPIKTLSVGDYLVVPINFMGKSLPFGAIVDERFMYVPINSISYELVEAYPVYNLTVARDHSYCVNYYGVANCTDPELNFEEFHFPSWENPSYTPQMDKEFRQEYSDTVYEHEILADWGTVEYGVFDWTHFERVFSYEFKPATKIHGGGFRPGEYTCLRLTAADVKRIGPNYVGSWLKARLPERNPLAKYYFGADLGYSADPSEFVVFEEFNGVMKLILRIHMERVTYDVQSDMIALLDANFMFHALGMDAGNNGQMVYQILTSSLSDSTGFNKYASHNFKIRLKSVQFGEMELLGKNAGHNDRVPVKELMTNLIIKQAEERNLIIPGTEYDEEIENQFRNHTYSISGSGRVIYSKSSVFPDHIVDAVRTAFYSKFKINMPQNRNWSVGSLRRGAGSGGWS